MSLYEFLDTPCHLTPPSGLSDLVKTVQQEGHTVIDQRVLEQVFRQRQLVRLTTEGGKGRRCRCRVVSAVLRILAHANVHRQTIGEVGRSFEKLRLQATVDLRLRQRVR